jgi:hypothetical protein
LLAATAAVKFHLAPFSGMVGCCAAPPCQLDSILAG